MTTPAPDVENFKPAPFRKAIVKWYDKHHRPLPWRSAPGEFPDPYHEWLSEIMLQQTTVQAVIPYYLKFLERWPTIHDLANAPSADVMENWAGLGYYARARNLHKCAIYVSQNLGGVFPDTKEGLVELPGIGDYTANAIAAIAFNRPANVVDGNVERVMARIFAVTDPVPDSKPVLKKLAGALAEGETKRPGDYAQGLMDLGATICTPTSPKCGSCPVREYCAGYEQGIAASLPVRKIKGTKPQRHGYIYWIRDTKGRILFEKRGEKGLLGGMVGLPTSEWVEKATKKTHLPFILKDNKSRIMVRHTFTHFDLELHGSDVEWSEKDTPEGGDYFWVTAKEAQKLGIPTVFKKALKLFI